MDGLDGIPRHEGDAGQGHAVSARAGHARRQQRVDSRLPRILDRAACLFREKGFQGASVRDIVGAVGMLPGSLYCHFDSKEDLLIAVYAEGVRRLSEAVEGALAGSSARGEDAWQRLEAACVAHLQALLDGGDYARVIVRVQPGDAPGAAERLISLRDGYESRFRTLVDALPGRVRSDRLRLLLLGALNWVPSWYRPGKESPGTIARGFLELLRGGS
jgi:TetR/AcrR family transcriptional regulator, cholesterol catabolism regulator